MRDTLRTGIASTRAYVVEECQLVPALFPGFADTENMPRVLATAHLVAMLERCCIEALADHLDAGEISLGVAIALEHAAPNIAGDVVEVTARVTALDGRVSDWRVEARTAGGIVGSATHRRAVVDKARFESRLPSTPRG